MTAKPIPKAPPQARRRFVQTAGDQKDFVAPAVELAKKLGWDGEPDWVQVAPARLVEVKDSLNKRLEERGEELLIEVPEVDHELASAHGISVRDAQRYCAKLLHEHFEAGALGKDQPNIRAACDHLAVDNADEQAVIEGACKAAYEAGKGAKVSEHPVKKASLDVEMKASASSVLGKLNNPVANVKKGT